ncbi:MAG: pyridoxal phosphate-dependent aminotransferase [Alphaproteobacteria bacterium]|nr:pyridoxal phosphate-dependent aminotransferase [Alphaproteobacteria bacterium]
MRPFSRASQSLQGSVYSRFAGRMSTYRGPVYPLHIGDTWMEPAEGCRMEDLRVADHPGMHRYTRVQGLPALVDALAAEVQGFTGTPTTAAEVLVGAGGTGCLAAAIGALVDPGARVVILAPHWPLVAGMVTAFGGEAVVVPFLGAVGSAAEAAALLASHLDDRTVAVYWNTPNNPTGRHIPRAWLEAMVEVCRAHDVVILADEVYERYVYSGTHTPSRPLAPERTVSIHSFSKAYGMAGNRVGWLVGPADLIEHAKRVSTHTFYSAPTGGQLAGLAALGPAGTAWREDARAKYAELGAYAADRLGAARPEGSTFLFLDVAEHLDEDGLEGFLVRAADRGLLLAPGPSFGPYPTHVRICFTSAAPDLVRAGVDVLADLLGR